MELYRQYRPKTWTRVLGQDKAVKVLKTLIARDDFPHALLLSGPSGTGKNTIARIIADKLDCHKDYYREVDAASFRGIEMIRDIQRTIDTEPMLGRIKLWTIDEAHMLTREAQNAILRILENPPNHVHFILNSTDPQKILKTIRTRCTEIHLNSIEDDDLLKIIGDVGNRAKLGVLSIRVAKKIVEVAKGSARKAIVLFDQIKDFETTQEQLDNIQEVDEEKVVFDLAKLLMGWGSSKLVVWSNAVNLLDKLKNEEPEKIRRLILACLVTEVKKGGRVAERASHLYEVWRDNFFDTGHAGLYFAVYASSSIK